MPLSFKEKLALVICTKDRPEELTNLMKSIESQTVLPYEILIVDGGTISAKKISEDFSKLNVRYFSLQPPSLTRQRNLGIKHLNPESTLVGFIDDDVVFNPDAIQEMLQFWETQTASLGGASFNVTNYNLTKIPSIKSWFLLDAPQRGALLRSGAATAYYPAQYNHKVEWLCGGATVWRREIFTRQLFDEFYTKLGWNEDVDFSYEAGRSRTLMVVASAQVIHHESKVSRINNFCFGQIQSVHRLYFVKKYNHYFSLGACYWACFGQTVVNLAKGVAEFNRGLCLRAFGNIFGILRFLLGRPSIYVPKSK